MSVDFNHFLVNNAPNPRNWVKFAEIVNKKFGTEYNHDSIRTKFNRLKEAAMKVPKDRSSAFKSFLLKARTEKEIPKKFGDTKFLKTKFEGLNLFTQRNNYHELVYILLPEPPKGIKLLPKKYTYRSEERRVGK